MNEREILKAALERSSLEDRTAFLDDACAGDLDLRTRVERLIAASVLSTFIADEPQQSATRMCNVDSTQDPDISVDAELQRSAETPGSESRLTTEYIELPSAAFQSLEGYEFHEVIGCGGMGVVAKGLDCALQRVVAIKTLSQAFASHPQARRRFLREAQVAAAARHENIVTIYTVNESAQSPFLVMEYIAGKSLQQRITECGPLPVDEIVRIARQIAAGLDAAHRIGLVHRDIKPANILLEDQSQRVKITDFGLARAMSDAGMTQPGVVAGTPQFMSPEQAQGQAVDHRSDLFSLGSVMYSMCVGEPAFYAETAVAALRRVCDDQPAAIQTVRKEIPHWLCDIVEKLMAKRPEDRFQTAAEVEHLLSAKLASEDFQYPPTSVYSAVVHPRASPSANRTRSIAPVVVAILAALAVGGWVLQKFRMSEDEAASRPLPKSGSQQFSKESDAIQPVPPEAVNPLLSADFEWAAPVNLGAGVNSPAHEDHACVSADGLTLIFTRSSQRRRAIWQSRRLNRDEPFGTAERLSESINANGLSEAPFLTSDGLTLWFVSSRAGGQGRNDIWFSHRHSVNEPFGEPANPGSPVDSEDNDASPFISPNGLTLLLARGQPRRIMQTTRPSANDPFDEPRALANVNLGKWSEFPRMTADGLAMIFVLSRVNGQQGLSLATRKSVADDFDPPVDLGPKVNDGTMSGPSLSADGHVLYFSSNRAGGFGAFDLWSIRRVHKAESNAEPPSQLSPSELLASAEYEWSPLEDLGPPVNTPGYEAGPFLAVDRLSLLFHSNEGREDRTGKLRIWQAWRHAATDPFLKPLPLEDVINDQPENLSDPTLTGDGLTLAFCMRRGDGLGEFDLWISDRPAGDASWNPPVNAGPGVNSTRSEWEPELSVDGLTLLFHSDRTNPNGGTDLWIARRDSRNTPFGPAENLGSNINTAEHEGGAALSSDGLTLLYHRFSADPSGTLSHWQSTRRSANHPFGKPRPLLIPGLIENQGTSLSLSAAADHIYCTTSRNAAPPNIAVSRRVPILAGSR